MCSKIIKYQMIKAILIFLNSCVIKKKKFIVNLHHHLVFHRPTPQVAFDYVGIEFFLAALLSTSATLLYT